MPLLSKASIELSFTDLGIPDELQFRAVGISSWRLHNLRRTMVTYMVRAGVAQEVSDRILNHKSGVISGVAAVYQQYDFSLASGAKRVQWSNTLLSFAIRGLS